MLTVKVEPYKTSLILNKMQTFFYCLFSLLSMFSIWAICFVAGRLAGQAQRRGDHKGAFTAISVLLLFVGYVLFDGLRTMLRAGSDVAITTTFSVCMIGLMIVVCLLLMIRTHAAANFRKRVLEGSTWDPKGKFTPYSSMADFDEMVWTFWRPIKSFIPAGFELKDLVVRKNQRTAVLVGGDLPTPIEIPMKEEAASAEQPAPKKAKK